MWQQEAARETVPLFADAHADGSAVRDRVKSRVLGDAVKLWVQVQRSVVACKCRVNVNKLFCTELFMFCLCGHTSEEGDRAGQRQSGKDDNGAQSQPVGGDGVVLQSVTLEQEVVAFLGKNKTQFILADLDECEPYRG